MNRKLKKNALCPQCKKTICAILRRNGTYGMVSVEFVHDNKPSCYREATVEESAAYDKKLLKPNNPRGF